MGKQVISECALFERMYLFWKVHLKLYLTWKERRYCYRMKLSHLVLTFDKTTRECPRFNCSGFAVLTVHGKMAEGGLCCQPLQHWYFGCSELQPPTTGTRWHHLWSGGCLRFLNDQASRVMVVHAFNPSTREAEAGRSLWVRGQPDLWELVPGRAPKLQRNPLWKNKNNKTKDQIDIKSPSTKHKA